MPAKLRDNAYGKSRVRLTKVVRRVGMQELFEMSVDVVLWGDFADSYLAGDNTKLIATDSMKNTVYVLAKEREFDSIDAFSFEVAAHFLETYPQVAGVSVSIEQTGWQRITVGGAPHTHAFVAGGGERRTCQATLARDESGATRIGGIKDLMVLKTAGSEFSKFVEDRFRTLADARERVFATSIDAEWALRAQPEDFNGLYDRARAALLETFATHHSLSVQQTLMAMGEAVLSACPDVGSVGLSLPNKHRIPFDLRPFKLENRNEIFVPTDEPYGLITGTVTRE
jgi:urate oxidase